jgi:predicted nucleic acid-binding protein
MKASKISSFGKLRARHNAEGIGTAGSLVSDAQIAAIALEHGAVQHTADSDFQRFPRLRWLNPLTGLASGRPRTRL